MESARSHYLRTTWLAAFALLGGVVLGAPLRGEVEQEAPLSGYVLEQARPYLAAAAESPVKFGFLSAEDALSARISTLIRVARLRSQNDDPAAGAAPLSPEMPDVFPAPECFFLLVGAQDGGPRALVSMVRQASGWRVAFVGHAALAARLHAIATLGSEEEKRGALWLVLGSSGGEREFYYHRAGGPAGNMEVLPAARREVSPPGGRAPPVSGDPVSRQ